MALGPGALGWVPGFVPLLAVAWWLAWRRRERSLLGGVVTVAAASLLGLVARHPVPHVPDAVTLVAVAACFGYFAGTVLYVKTMIRERGDERFHWLSALAHGAATVAMTWLSPWLVLVFALLTIRAAVMPAFRVSPKAVGIGEIIATVAVAATALLVT